MVDISKATPQLMKLFDKIEKGIEDGVKEGLKVSFERVVELTPVAEPNQDHPGWLRNNWQASIGSKGAGTIGYNGKVSIQSTVSRITKDMKDFGYGQELYFHNNLDYAYDVEYLAASPQKAPQGMLRLGMVNVDINIADALQDKLNKIK